MPFKRSPAGGIKSVAGKHFKRRSTKLYFDEETPSGSSSGRTSRRRKPRLSKMAS